MDKKENLRKYYKFGLYIVAVILVNLVGISLFFRLDLTSNNLYSLSGASKEAVSTLEEPLTINVFFSKNLPAPYNNIERYLHDLLEEYAAHANRHLSYRFYDVTASEGDLSEKAEENRKLAQSYGVHPVNVQVFDQDEVKVQRAYMGIVFIHGDITEKIPAVTSTEGLEYKITAAIRKLNNKISALLNLPEKIKVILVQSSSLSAVAPVIKLQGLDSLKPEMEEVVDRLNKKTYGRLEFVHIDPSVQTVDREKMKKFERFGLRWPTLATPEGLRVEEGSGFLAVGLEYGKKSVEKQILSRNLGLTSEGFQEQFQIADIKAIETFINENIDNLIDINEDLGYLSSHGTLTLSPGLPPQLQMMRQNIQSLKELNARLEENYTVKQIDLKSEEIPDSIDTLMIVGPKENFSDYELFQIDQFLMKGKSLAIFMDAFNEIQQQNRRQMYQMNQPIYIPLNTGLEKLLTHYGVGVKKSYVMDESCYIDRGDVNREQVPFYFVPIIHNENINHDFDFMQNIKELLVAKISPVDKNDDKIKKNNLKVHRLFASSEESWEMKGRINLFPMFIRPPTDEKEKDPRDLAYLIEGEFPSYFADKPIPEKPKEKEEGEAEDNGNEDENKKDKKEKDKPKPPVKESGIKTEKEVLFKGRPGRIFLIGSTDILKDNLLNQRLNPNMAPFLLNTLDYLNNREDIAVMRSKVQRFNPIRKGIKPFTRVFVKALNIGGLPILLIVFGIFVWFRRKARRRKIQAMFTK